MTVPSAGRSRVSLHLHGASFSHSTAVAVLDRVDLDLGPGIHGLVGANGAGKSTVLDLVDGTRRPTAGRVDVIADGPVVRVHQHVDAVDDRVTDLGQRWDGAAVAWRRRFALDVDDLHRWSDCSPGMRMRWQVAAALAVEPDVLLLDEPTNHLDADGRDTVARALERAAVGLVVLVSHDRALLDRLTTSTVRLAGGRLDQWAGGWTAAHDRWEAADRSARREHSRARRDADRATRLAAQARTRLRGVERGAAASRRDAGPGDPDMRGSLARAHADAAARSLATQVAARRSAAERAAEAVDDAAVRRRRGGPITVATTVSGRDVVSAVRTAALAAGDHVVLRDVAVAVTPTDRIRLDGPNGAGKTTLLRALAAASRVPVGVLPQDVDLTAGDRDRLLAADDRHRMLAILDHLGVDPDRLLASARPSPGEARKLVLADLVVRPRPLLLLDEPTNHLDIESIARLEEALVDHPSALVLVSHDRALAGAVTDTTWQVGHGRVEVDPPGTTGDR